jgi:hypothetical protein
MVATLAKLLSPERPVNLPLRLSSQSRTSNSSST